MESTIERKCSKCGQWNKSLDICQNCHAPISIEAIEKIENQVKQEKELKKEDDKFDLLMEKLKQHPNILVRGVFYIFYSVGLAFMAIGSFFAFLTAWASG